MLFGVKANVGSNPTVTATENPRETGGFLHLQGLFLSWQLRRTDGAAEFLTMAHLVGLPGQLVFGPLLKVYVRRTRKIGVGKHNFLAACRPGDTACFPDS